MAETTCTGQNCHGHPHSPECRAEYARSLQSNRSDEMESKWQPIESAPKEGSFIVWCPERQNMFLVSGRDRFEGRFRIFGADDLLRRNEPTHWLPLPKPPEQ